MTRTRCSPPSAGKLLSQSVTGFHRAVACKRVGIDLSPWQLIEQRDQPVAKCGSAHHELIVVPPAVCVGTVEPGARTAVEQPIEERLFPSMPHEGNSRLRTGG